MVKPKSDTTKIKQLRVPVTVKRASATKGAKGKGVVFVASTPTVDRGGDRVEQNFDLSAFERNPVMMYCHDYEGLPIARLRAFKDDDGNLCVEPTWVPKAIYPFADTVRQMYEHEPPFLSAVSIGVRYLETKNLSPDERKEAGLGAYGEWATRSELVEVSACPVPVNAEALAKRSATGPKIAPLWATKSKDRRRIARMQKAGAQPDAVSEWLAEVDAAVKAEENAMAELIDAILAILQAEEGVTPESLAEAIAKLEELREMAGGEEETDEEEPEAEEEEAPAMAAVLRSLQSSVDRLTDVLTKSADNDEDEDDDAVDFDEILGDSEKLDEFLASIASEE